MLKNVDKNKKIIIIKKRINKIKMMKKDVHIFILQKFKHQQLKEIKLEKCLKLNLVVLGYLYYFNIIEIYILIFKYSSKILKNIKMLKIYMMH